MNKRKATTEDYDALKTFYDEMIEAQKTDKYGPKWTKGEYPSDEDISRHLEQGEFHIGLEDGKIVSAAVLSKGEDPEYERGNWINSEDIMVLHLFGIGNTYRHRGYGEEMLKYLAEYARENQAKSIHLDVLVGNVPAFRLYEKMGMSYRGLLDMSYDDLGEVDVDLFEYVL